MRAKHWTGDDDRDPEPNGLSYHDQLWQDFAFAHKHGYGRDWLLGHDREELPPQLRIARDEAQRQQVVQPQTHAEQVYARR